MVEIKENETNQYFVNSTTTILKDNPEWEDIYERYATNIQNNSDRYKANSREFQVNKPITVYSSIGKVMNGTSYCYDLRYAGQSIANVKITNKGIKLFVSEDQADYAKKNFGFEKSKKLNGVGWRTEDATEFRRFYYSQDNNRDTPIKSEEHRIESWILREFAKHTRFEDKKLCNIQPVRLGGKFFQLTTPLKASTHQPEISLTKERSGATGGGIDILARVKHNNNRPYLAIIELKDENTENEPQRKVMFQALTYATFVAHLLRSKSGKKWWGIFGFTNEVPKKLELDVVTLMPEGNSTEGCPDSIEIEELKVKFNLHTLYYQEDVEGNPCSFSGTLKDVIKKH